MSYWVNDPELFLYAKGTGPDDVLLRRCKKMVSSSSSSLVVPMKPDDFDFVKIVKNHMELIGDMFDWDESDYKRLVKYIYERLLLVNGQGLVIAEIYKLNDTNEVPIYIRSLDVLRLKPYIPNLRKRPIPLRTVKYLGDVNGKAAMMEEDYNVTKLTARVVDLESENKTLVINITKLTADQVAMTDKGNDLESKNKILDTNITKLTARVANLEAENTRLESRNNTLDTSVMKLTADMITQMNAMATLQRDLNENPNIKEVWMNYLSPTNSTEWVGIENLRTNNWSPYVGIRTPKDTFTRDDNSTNVRASNYLMAAIGASTNANNDCIAVLLEDLTPNTEKARFSKDWLCITLEGKTYIFRLASPAEREHANTWMREHS